MGCTGSAPTAPTDEKFAPTTSNAELVSALKGTPEERAKRKQRIAAARAAQIAEYEAEKKRTKHKLHLHHSSHHGGGISKRASEGHLSQLALKFPLIRHSAQILRVTFDKFKVGDKVPNNQLGAALTYLVRRDAWTEAQLNAIFTERSPSGVAFKPFVVAVAAGFFLKEDVGDDENLQAIQTGFSVVQKIFAKIDDDNSGEVQLSELKAVLGARDGDELLEKRMAELDVNGDGDVEFTEFLYGILSWVGLGDE